MKLSAAAVLLAIAGADAWSQPSRASLRAMGQKTVSMNNGPRRKVEASMKMEGMWCCGAFFATESSLDPLKDREK